MTEFTAPSRRTVIISISAVLGIAAISSLAYLYIYDRKHSTRRSQFRSLQRNLHSDLLKSQDTLDDLVENDLRLIQVRIKTLRTHRLYPGDDHVQLPSLGLINEQDKVDLGADLIEESKEELIRERTLGFDDHGKVREGYKQVDLLVKALRKQLVRLSERVDAMDLSELAEVGEEADSTGGITMMMVKEKEENEPTAIQVLDKVRTHRRSVLGHIRKVIAQLDRIQASYQDKLEAIKAYERMEGIGLEPTDDVEPTVDSEMMRQGVTFADVAGMNIEEPEILAPTEDLERMKQGVSFAAVVAENLPVETESSEVLKPTEDLEKMKQGITFADVVASDKELGTEEVLAPTQDLEKMRQGVSFADVAAKNAEEQEILAPTGDSEARKGSALQK